jgi:hypothetical protein
MPTDLPPCPPRAVASDILDDCPYFRRLAVARTVARLSDGRINFGDDATEAALVDLVTLECHRVIGPGHWQLFAHVHDELGAFLELDHPVAGRRVLAVGDCLGHAAASGLLLLWAARDTVAERMRTRPIGPTAEA